ETTGDEDGGSGLLVDLAPLRETYLTQRSKDTKGAKKSRLIRDPHLPEHEGIIKRSFAKGIVTSRRATMARAEVNLQNQRIVIGPILAQLGHELCAFPIGNLTIVEGNLHEHRLIVRCMHIVVFRI